MSEKMGFNESNIYQGDPSDFDGMNPESTGAKPEGNEATQERAGEVGLSEEELIDKVIKNAKKLFDYEDVNSDSKKEGPERENSEQENDESKIDENVDQKVVEGNPDQFNNIDGKNVEGDFKTEKIEGDIEEELPQWSDEDILKYFEKNPKEKEKIFEKMNEAERSAKERMGEIEDEIRELKEQKERIDEQRARIDEQIRERQEEYEGVKKDENRERVSVKLKEGFARKSKVIGEAIGKWISKNKKKIARVAIMAVFGVVGGYILYSQNVENIQTKLNDPYHPGEEITSISENDDDESEKEKQFEQIKVQIGDEEKDISLDFGDYEDNSVQHRLIDPTNPPEDVTIDDKRDEVALSASMFDVESAKDESDEQITEEGINGTIHRLDEPAFNVSIANLYDDAGQFKIGDRYFSIDSSKEMTKFVLEEANKSEYIRSEFTDLIVKESIKKLAEKAPVLRMRTIEANSHYIASCVEASIKNGNLEDLKYYIDWDFKNNEDQKILQFFTEDGVNQLDINEIGSEKYNYLKAFGAFDDKTDSEAIELMKKVECVGLSLNTGQMVYMWKGDGGGNGGGVVNKVIDPVSSEQEEQKSKPKPTPTPTSTPSTPPKPTGSEEIVGKTGNVPVGDNFNQQGVTNVDEATQGNTIVTQESTGTSVNNNSPGASTGGAGEQSSESGTQNIPEGGNTGNDSKADQSSAGENNPNLTTNEAINIENDIANGN